MIDTQIGFVGQPLDRADHIRNDKEALEALKDERALLLRLEGLDPLMDDENRLQWGSLAEAGDAIADDAAILDGLETARGLAPGALGADYRRSLAEARAQLIDEVGGPSPYRLA